jgi:outer membrane biosynthesis protein TonB
MGMAAGRFVLENDNGQVVRTFGIDSETLYIVYRHDVRRVEVIGDVQALSDEGISFDILKKTSASAVEKRALALDNGARFRFVKEVENVVQSVNLPDDSEEQEKLIYKRVAIAQLGVMLFILIVGLLIEPFFTDKPEEEVVTVIPQHFVQQKEQVTVKMAEQKVDPHIKVANKKVESKVKVQPKQLTAKVKAVRKENAPLRTKVKVETAGALGALGGMKSGSKNSAGFNMAALNDSKGTSWNGAGSGGVGGMERAVHGKGLIASSMGRGERIEGGGGYGTRGKAGGGRPGYGSMNMGGTAAAYFEPLDEEAMVEGGLDKDQIAAVINRHIGEVIYCYEKGLQVKPGLSGRVGVKFTINGAGQVSSAGVGSTSLNSAQVEGCILNRLRTWKFPKPVGGVNVKVAYPFVLKRVNQ